MKYLSVLAVIILFIVSCTKTNHLEDNCINQQLDEYNMIAFEGQDIGCKLHLMLYTYQEAQYFALGSHCVDMVLVLKDCAGNDVPESHYDNAEYVEIIGFEE